MVKKTLPKLKQYQYEIVSFKDQTNILNKSSALFSHVDMLINNYYAITNRMIKTKD